VRSLSKFVRDFFTKNSLAININNASFAPRIKQAKSSLNKVEKRSEKLQ